MNETIHRCEQLEMYALGGLDAQDCAAFEQHLEECPACREGLDELLAVIELLPLAAEPMKVPEGMQARVLSSVMGTSPTSERRFEDLTRAADVVRGAEVEETWDVSGSGVTEQEREALVGKPEAAVEAAEKTRTELSGFNNGRPDEPMLAAEVSALEREPELRAVEQPTVERAAAERPTAVPMPLIGGQEPACLTAEDRPAEVEAETPVPRRVRRARRRDRFKPWIYGVLSAAVLLLGWYAFDLRSQVRELRGEMALNGLPSEGAQIRNAVTLSGATADIVAQGLATVVIDAKGAHLLVQAEKLPQLQGSEAYQVWLIKGEAVVNAGTFVSYNGTGGLYYTMNLQDYDQIAITLEPDAHGEKPRGKPVLAAKLVKS